MTASESISPGPSGATGQRPLIIRGARLVDARSEEPLAGDTLIVDGDGRIVKTGFAGRTLPDDGAVIDADGATLVPGLIDCHVHMALAYEPIHDVVQRSFTENVARMLDCGRRFLESGVTTVRDAGGTPAGIKRVFARREFPGPRLQVSVMPLSITGGHGDARTRSGVDLDGDRPAVEMPLGIADGIDEVRGATRRIVRAGADWIKVMATGGVWSPLDEPGAVQYAEEEMRVMVDVAHSARLRGVFAHAENAPGIKNALRAGVRSIDHGFGLDDEAIDLMLERDVPLVPTFLIGEEASQPDVVASGGTPPWAVAKAHAIADAADVTFRHAVDRGVRIAMGTDGGFGSHLPAELSLMSEHGLSPIASLRAATIEAARLLDLDEEVGVLESGMKADLLLIDGDPLAEPSLWRDPSRILAVVQDGRVVVDPRGV